MLYRGAELRQASPAPDSLRGSPTAYLQFAVARAPEEAALVEETLSFHVKANGSDEAPMRQRSRTRSWWNCGEPENCGEHARRKSNASKKRRRKRGSSSKKAAQFQTENNRGVRAGVQAEDDEWTLQPNQQRRRAVFARVDGRAATKAQIEKRSLEARSERGWYMSTPNSNGDEHGEIHGNRESSAQRRFWQVKN